MKTFTTILLVGFGILFCQGQEQLKLSIKKGSDAPNFKTEHMYLLELSNLGSIASNVSISIENKECANIKKSDQTKLIQELFDNKKQSQRQQIVVPSGKSVEFYIKLSRPNGARLNTWNCSEIVAMSKEGKIMSNSITIETLIPNSNNNN